MRTDLKPPSTTTGHHWTSVIVTGIKQVLDHGLM